MFRNKIWNILVVIGVSTFIVLSILLYTKPVYVVQYSELKRILYWNEKYGSKNEFCCGRGPYKKYKCANDACHTSKDRTNDLSTFDAIQLQFHGRNLNTNDLSTKS